MKHKTIRIIGATLACALMLTTHALAKNDFFDDLSGTPASSTLATPRSAGPNFSLEGGFAYLLASNVNNMPFSRGASGLTASLGWRIDQNNKVQFEYASFDSVKFLLLAWNAYIPFDKFDTFNHWEWRVSPTIGKLGVKRDYRYGGESNVFTCGIGTGITCHINSLFYVDAGCRFLWASLDLSTWTFTGAVGLKF